VLRLRPGEEVTASDGVGGWRRCEYGGNGRVVAVGDIEVVARPAPLVTVAFALTKGERPEWTVQKLAEAGVDRIIPMTTGRSVVRWDGDKAARQVVRLRAVVVAAAMQSRQVWLPVVDGVVSFTQLALTRLAPPQLAPPGAALAQMGGDPPSLERPFILVGPEGGWDEAELASGLPFVTLGPTVLRAETAAMAAGLLLCGLRARVVRPG
jgi:16S rRNA (uracil1498-N3)-methyltransferase